MNLVENSECDHSYANFLLQQWQKDVKLFFAHNNAKSFPMELTTEKANACIIWMHPGNIQGRISKAQQCQGIKQRIRDDI